MHPFANTVPGYLCAYAFKLDGSADAIAEAHVRGHLSNAKPWFWLHLNLTDQRCCKWLETHLPVNGFSWSQFVEPVTRPAVKTEAGAIHGRLVALRREHGEGFAEQALLSLVLTPEFLVTGRIRPLHEPDALRKQLKQGRTFSSPGELLAALVGQHVEELEHMAGDLLERLERIEDHVFDEARTAERQALMAARRDGTYAHRLVRLSRRLLLQSSRSIDAWPQAMEPNLQRLSNLDQDLELVEQRARFLHDELDAKLAAETNRQLYVLSIVTAVFLPPSLVASLFGMNLQGIPAGENPYGFWFAVVAGLAAACLVGLVIRQLTRR